jgi:preprotein translocase subunit SecB
MAESNEQQFAIERIYIKDVSYEAPHSPGEYDFENDWNPDTNVQLNTGSQKLGEDLYEVVLTITVTVKANKKVAFLVEIKQAGRFLIKGFDDQALVAMNASFCPNILFPFAREEIASLVMKGGFPQTLLAPVNFDALYAQHLQQQAQQKAQEAAAGGQETSASKH